MTFAAGVIVGALGMYGYLLYACQRAAEQFDEALREEIAKRP